MQAKAFWEFPRLSNGSQSRNDTQTSGAQKMSIADIDGILSMLGLMNKQT